VPKARRQDTPEGPRLNLGCGLDYRPAWFNIDANRTVRADAYCDFSQGLPFADNAAAHILLDNVLEHVPRNAFLPYIDELHRVLMPGGILDIYVPHYSGMWAFKHVTHYNYFGVGTFDVYSVEGSFNGERYGAARFQIDTEELLFFHHNLQSVPWLSRLPINGLFNLGTLWKQVMERFQPFGFDEIHYRLRAVK